MNAGATLLELLQRESRQAHARQLPEMHSVILRVGSRAMNAPLAALAAWRDKEAQTPDQSVRWATPIDEPVDIPVLMMADHILEHAITETYATAGAVWEGATELRVRRACAKWLAFLAQQYVHALDVGLSHDAWWPLEREAWRLTATHWYSRTAVDEPDQAHAYLSLAALHRSEPLAALYFLSKSVQTVQPDPGAADALHAWALSIEPSAPLLYGLAQIVLRQDGSAALAAVPRVTMLLETEWAQLGVCMITALLEFAHPDAALDARALAAHSTPSDARVDSMASMQALHAFSEAGAPRTPSLAPSDVARACAARGLPAPLGHALALFLALLRTALIQLPATLAPAVFVVLTLSFLQVLTLRTHLPAVDALCDVLNAALPWDLLMAFVRSDVLHAVARSADAQWRLALTSGPDDWYFRGLSWPTWAPTPSAPWAPDFQGETDMLAERRAAALRAQMPNAPLPSLPLAQMRHARTALLVALLRAQLARYDGSSLV
ncbi:hypothetical protein MCAP1_000726 [Malassezia caprae]|uniref:Uncharacterized protein n=1 Tax=Malassezia caprae TaxID=1381934 RepID=A0AAF0E2Z4_9BASI|nr:hypothetical protein MCAP1_000726 [Malassezia caprae]